MNLFDTKDSGYVRSQFEEFLKEEENDGCIEILRNDDHFIEAKIVPRKRMFFYLHYGAFRFKGKTLDFSIFDKWTNVKIGNGDLDINHLDLNGFLDNVSVTVDY